ncbi:hypothetical protein KHA80_20360 [Anaerobacillus sp. HL2]|nr:hypothetical protein KHA80_20360 [Anaerobacillus sp. HL2]
MKRKNTFFIVAMSLIITIIPVVVDGQNEGVLRIAWLKHHPIQLLTSLFRSTRNYMDKVSTVESGGSGTE